MASEPEANMCSPWRNVTGHPLRFRWSREPAVHLHRKPDDALSSYESASTMGLTEYALYSGGSRQRRRWRCKRCVGEAVTRRKQKIKRMLVDEAGGCCTVCGYARCVVNLHFHHVDPAQKAFALSMSTTKALASYREEVKKCVLLCANCHGEIETGLIQSPPAGAKYSLS